MTTSLGGTVTSAQSATACTSGNYSASGNVPCTAASAGYHVPGGSATNQTICPINTYQNLTGQSSCTACPVNTASPAGSTSAGACVTVINTYTECRMTATRYTVATIVGYTNTQVDNICKTAFGPSYFWAKFYDIINNSAVLT